MTRFWLFATLVAVQPATAQSLEARFGLLATSTLVRDEGGTPALQRALGLQSLAPMELKLSAAPAASILFVQPISARTAIDVSASFALARLRASTSDTHWTVQNVSLVAATVGLRQHLGRGIWANAGFGANRFFAESTGIFADGSDTTPLFELGALFRHSVAGLPLHVAARIQTHRFSTEALRRETAPEGNPARVLLQFGIGR